MVWLLWFGMLKWKMKPFLMVNTLSFSEPWNKSSKFMLIFLSNEKILFWIKGRRFCVSFLLSVFALNMDQSLNILKFELFFKVYKNSQPGGVSQACSIHILFFSFLNIFPSSIRKWVFQFKKFLMWHNQLRVIVHFR